MVTEGCPNLSTTLWINTPTGIYGQARQLAERARNGADDRETRPGVVVGRALVWLRADLR
jgi:hypothetical protein